MNCLAKLLWLTIGLLGACAVGEARAQSVVDQFNKGIRPSHEIEPLGPDLFGDQVNLLDGALSFEITDVVAKTNHQIPVSIGRVLSIQDQVTDETMVGTGREQFGSMWDFDIPHMKVATDARFGWVASDGSLNRCSSNGASMPQRVGVPPFSTVVYDSDDYSSGVNVRIPGYGSNHLGQIAMTAVAPTDGLTYTRAGKGGWRLRCIPTMQRGLGEGFILLLPNGLQYRFDWMVDRRAPYLMDTTCPDLSSSVFPSPNIFTTMIGLEQCLTNYSVPRSEYLIFATEAKDRFGNVVKYEFDQVNPQRLTRIISNGEAVINVTYTTGTNRIDKITMGSQTWTYRYNGTALSEVELPNDGVVQPKWVYHYGSDFKNVNRAFAGQTWDFCQLHIGTRSTSVASGEYDTSWIRVTHPSGAQGEFLVRRVLHGTKESESLCELQTLGPFGGVAAENLNGPPSAYQIVSLYKKTISGPSINTQVWNYAYSPGWQSPFEALTTVTHSSGRVENYRFDTNRANHYGDLISKAVGTTAQVLETTNYEYATGGAAPYFPTRENYDYTVATSGWSGFDAYENRPLRRVETILQGRKFIWEVNANCGTGRPYCFDQFAQPTAVTRKNVSQ